MTTPARPIKPPSLEDVPENIDPRLRDLLEAIINTLDLREGRVAKGTNTRFVTVQDLVDTGLITDGDLT